MNRKPLMDTDEKTRPTSTRIWIIIALLAAAILATQLLYPDGLRGLLRDLVI